MQVFQLAALYEFDNMAKSLFSDRRIPLLRCGILFELCLTADRSYMFLDDDGEMPYSYLQPTGTFPMANETTDWKPGIWRSPAYQPKVMAAADDGPIDAESADELGLVTASLDDIDYEDEVRIAIEDASVCLPMPSLGWSRISGWRCRKLRDQNLRAP